MELDPDYILSKMRDADVCIEHVFTMGSCYQLYLIMKAIFPSAMPFINERLDHVCFDINGVMYDIRGVVNDGHKYHAMTQEEVTKAEAWSFSNNCLIKLTECPYCEEPFVYEPSNYGE